MSALAVVTRPPDQDTDDLYLVAGVRAGDKRAFELLFVRYQPRIGAYVRGMVNDHDRAEDITQEVFISALRRLRETDREIAFKPWIYEIAKNACIDAFRRSRSRDEVSFDAGDGLGADDAARLAEPGANSVVEGKVAFDNLCGAFGGLSQSHHEILVMREFEGLSYRQIGERLGMSRPAVESTLFRARRRLSEEYEQLVSGERCLRVQRIVDAGGGSAPSLRDQRRMARHLAHCQACRRYACLAGVEIDAVTKRPAAAAKAARIAALVPLPMFLRRRSGAEEASQLLGHQGAAPVAQWSASVAGTLDPALVGGWTKAVATAATVAVASIGAGAAITKRDVPQGFIGQVPAVVSASASGSSPAGSGSAAARMSGVGVLRRSVSSGGARFVLGPDPAAGSVRGGEAGGTAVVGGPRRTPGSPREDEPPRSGDSSPAPGSAAADRGAAWRAKIKGVTDKLDLALPLPRGKTGGAAGGATGGGSGTMSGTREPQRTVRRLIEKLRDGGGGAGARRPRTTPPPGRAPVLPALPELLPPSAAAGSAVSQPSASSAPAAPTSTGPADTVSDVSAAYPTTPPPARPPS